MLPPMVSSPCGIPRLNSNPDPGILGIYYIKQNNDCSHMDEELPMATLVLGIVIGMRERREPLLAKQTKDNGC